MMRGWSAVFYREMLILRRRLWRLCLSMSVSPVLYLLAFGYALGRDAGFEGRTYLEFLVPGLAAMASMTQAWSIASEINIARFYFKIFEEIQAAPVSAAGYVMGEVLAGVVRALLAVGIILVFSLAFGVRLHVGSAFVAGVTLNAFLFASLAVAMAMLVKSHADQSMISSLVITPMAFLGGTFFPLDRLPQWAQSLLGLLPLTHAARAVRNAAFAKPADPGDFFLLAGLGAACFGFAWACVRKARD